MKLIAIDMDGTLLNNKNEISKENIKAIRFAQEQGIEVVIATGRAYFDAISICKKAGIHTDLISDNGAVVHSKEGKKLASIPMEKKDVNQIVKWLEENAFYYEVFTEKAIYTSVKTREILRKEIDFLGNIHNDFDRGILEQAMEKQFGQIGFIFVENYKAIMEKEEEFYNISGFSFDEEKRKLGMKTFKDLTQLSVFSSLDHNFEIVNKEASKGNALKMLGKKLHISLDESVAIGDNYNDVSMFKKAKYSVAMENAKEDIKKMCTFTTKSNNENGVAHAIYKLMKRQFSGVTFGA